MIMLDSKNENTESNSFSNENASPAIRKSSPKQEEEISIEDIPF